MTGCIINDFQKYSSKSVLKIEKDIILFVIDTCVFLKGICQVNIKKMRDASEHLHSPTAVSSFDRYMWVVKFNLKYQKLKQ